MKPTIGRIVHYFATEFVDKPQAALVADVHEDTVDVDGEAVPVIGLVLSVIDHGGHQSPARCHFGGTDYPRAEWPARE